ncbi:MAG: cytochrome c [Actinomycetota bacterium]|nr:cytochrome c [Actinomycetota bacterium]
MRIEAQAPNRAQQLSGGDGVATENEDGRELENRSYFAIGAVLGLAASLGLALLVVMVVNTASSVKDAVSPSSPVPVAAPAADPSIPADTAGDGVTADGTGTDAGAALISAGLDLASTKGCLACHSTNDRDGVGPTWTGLFGSDRNLEDGSTATADDAYLLESIVDPQAKVVDGFIAGIMPGNFGDSLSQEELDALLAYIKSL